MKQVKRLDKILGNLGYGSRTELKILAKSGAFKVNGNIIKDSGIHVDPSVDNIEVKGEIVNYREKIYLLMNKPNGVISATYDKKHRTVIDILKDEYKCFKPFPIGRLDIDTEGLLIITNDGELTHNLLSPKKHVNKKYYAIVEGFVDLDDVEAFKEGVHIDGYKTLPSILEIVEAGSVSKIELTIFEGKFHQVKKMFESIGKSVIYLRRIQMGSLKLDESLNLGEVRELTNFEINNLKSC